MWKTCQVKCGGLCRISLDGRAMLAGVHGLRSGAGGSFPPRRLDGFFLLAWQGCFCHWAGCGVESLMVFSFACPAARYSAKEARGRPRMALTGRRGEAAVDACCLRRSRGGAEISGFTSLGRTGARTRSGPHTKRARLSASLVRGWIFGCLRASEKSLYQKCRWQGLVPCSRGYAWTWWLESLRICLPDAAARPKTERSYRFTPKKRHQATWTYGKFLSQKLVKKLLDY